MMTPKFVAETLGTYLPGLLNVAGNTAGDDTPAASPAAFNDDLLIPFTNVTSDSRKVKEGSLFVALKGDKFDGHDFIDAAVKQGARGIICRTDYHANVFKTVKVFSVDNTLGAYRKLSAAWRDQFTQIPVVGIAGSVGKTTTKEILGALLQGRFPNVLRTEGSQNGFIGIPMTMLEITPEHGAAVIEIGIDEIGTMVQHMDLVRPDYSVLTAIGPEHLERLIDIDTVAREESIALSSVASQGGTIIVNLDDPYIAPHWKLSVKAPGRKLGFTLKAKAKADADTLTGNLSSDGETLEVSGMGLEKVAFKMPLPGAHNAQNLLAALAVACALGLGQQELQAGLSQFKGAYGRSEMKSLKSGAPVLCDYYNANPASVEAGLEVLTQIARKGRDGIQPRTRWVCLADMLELGTDEEKLHRGLADRLCALKIENVLLFGPRMKNLLDELNQRRAKGQFSGTAAHFETHADLAKDLLARLGSETSSQAVMIKGSRGMKMEEVWKAIAT